MKKRAIIFLAALLTACSARGQQTYHIMISARIKRARPAAKSRFYETTELGQRLDGHYVGLKAPASIASNFVLTLPAALPTSTTRCLEATTAGVIQYASAACGTGGGGGFYQTVQEAGTARTQRAALNFLSPFTATDDGANDRTNIALTTSPSGSPVGTGRTISTTSPITGGGDLSANRTISCATCVTTDTTQTITGEKTFGAHIKFSSNNTYDIGAWEPGRARYMRERRWKLRYLGSNTFQLAHV